MNRILLIISILLTYSCESISQISIKEPSTIMSESDNTLVERLANNSYGNFYNYALQEQIINQVWNEVGGVTPLKSIVLDEKAPNKARLIAHEILLKKEFTYLRAEDVEPQIIAQIYAPALAENTTGMANSWGLLYEHNDMGAVGFFVAHLGKDALPALLPLLDNTTTHMYQGSEAATVGNGYQFQVRDFAAYYISRILNEPSPYHADRAARNQEIERLRKLAQEH